MEFIYCLLSAVLKRASPVPRSLSEFSLTYLSAINHIPLEELRPAMPSFDVVSRTKLPEVDNAIQGAMREIGTRYDFKGSTCSIERTDETLTLKADDELKLKQVQDVLNVYLTRRKVDTGAFQFSESEMSAGNTVRQSVTIQQGVERETAQKIVKAVKASKMKVQVAIQGDELRLSGKKRDDLTSMIELIKGMSLKLPLQFVNFRD